ncbi:MAG: rhomboid family intramembrane serine protease [Bryobacteraceae bacterium]
MKDRTCPYCGQEVGRRAIDVRSPGEILGGLIPAARFTTVIILLLNFGLYAATAVYSIGAGNAAAPMDIDGMTLYRFGAKLRPAIQYGEWWRLVTAGFLHGGLMHIFMNSFALFDLSTQVETMYGTSRLLVFYLVSTVGGFLASTWYTMGLSIGASAGVFGLIGVMIAYGVTERTAAGAAVKGMYMRWAIYGLLFGFLPGLRVDNAAHIGGLAAGFGCAYLAGTPRLGDRAIEKLWRIAGMAAVAITVFCFLKMYLSFSNPLM